MWNSAILKLQRSAFLHYTDTRSPAKTRKKRKTHLLAQNVHFPQINVLANTSTSTLMGKLAAAQNLKKTKNTRSDAKQAFSQKISVRKRMPLWHYTENASPVKSWKKRKTHPSAQNVHFAKITCRRTRLIRHLRSGYVSAENRETKKTQCPTQKHTCSEKHVLVNDCPDDITQIAAPKILKKNGKRTWWPTM